jgi:hypothetical protein
MALRRHAKVMADLINDRGFTKIAEVGVWKGRFMAGVLWSCPQITEYWGIDSWQVLNNPEYHEGNMLLLDDKGWEETYLYVCRYMLQYKSLRLIRAGSLEASKLFPDGYFDLVFIDADHTYEYVLADIKAWTPKVRKGGIISGHDCIKKLPGVPKAVEECFGEDGTGWHRLRATCWMKEIE